MDILIAWFYLFIFYIEFYFVYFVSITLRLIIQSIHSFTWISSIFTAVHSSQSRWTDREELLKRCTLLGNKIQHIFIFIIYLAHFVGLIFSNITTSELFMIGYFSHWLTLVFFHLSFLICHPRSTRWLHWYAPL